MSAPAPRMAMVPSLAEVANDRTVLETLPVDVLIRLRREAGYLREDIEAALTRLQARPGPNSLEPERVVLIDEAAAMLATSTDSLYSKWRKLPFAFKCPLDNKIKFRVSGIKAYLTARTGRNAP